MKKYLFLIVCLVPLAASAQLNIHNDTITWNSNLSVNLHANESLTSNVIFKSLGHWKVEMTMGTVTNEFIITASEGMWQNLQDAGSVTHQVDFYGTPGLLKIERIESGVISILLDLSASSDTGMKQEFIIDSYTAN